MGEREKFLTSTVITPDVGHGNPLTAVAIAYLLGGYPLSDSPTSLQLIKGPMIFPLKKTHSLMIQSEKVSRLYTEKSESLRGGLAAIAIGWIELFQWLMNERFSQLKGEPLSDIGIFIQEHLLGILPSSFLEKLFPKGVFLYIPDVYPKESAVAILKKLKSVVTPLVWNRSAYLELKSKGLSPVLVAPVLPSGFLKKEEDQINKEQKEVPQKIVIKTSGSGIGQKLEGFLNEKVINHRQPNQKVEYWRQDEVKRYDNQKEEKEDYSDIQEYGRAFYSSLLSADEIISYPSEMVQVVAWLKMNGWRGKFIALPPRGRHEQRNLKWAKEMGLIDGVVELANEGFCIKESTESFDPNKLETELGTINLEELVSVVGLFKSYENVSLADVVDIFDFISPESSVFSLVFETIKESFSLLLEVYGSQRRRVNGGLYLRHIFKTALVAKSLKDLMNQEIDEERLILAALFHDAFEMNKELEDKFNKFNKFIERLKEFFAGKEESWYQAIFADVKFLTPSSSDKNLNYLQRKREDFDRFIPKDENESPKTFDQLTDDERIRFLVKVADVYANLYETVVDLRKGKKDGKKSIEDQYQKFSYRVERIGEVLGEENEFYQRMKELLEEFKKLKESKTLSSTTNTNS